MNILFTDFISKINFGEVQTFKNLQLIPLFTEEVEGPLYLTLKEALEKRLLVITEVSMQASVPNLKVINNADLPVLLFAFIRRRGISRCQAESGLKYHYFG